MFRLASSLREEEFSVCEPYEVISIRVMLYLATKAEAFERLNFMVVYGLWAALIRSKYHGPKSLLRKMILNKKTYNGSRTLARYPSKEHCPKTVSSFSCWSEVLFAILVIVVL